MEWLVVIMYVIVLTVPLKDTSVNNVDIDNVDTVVEVTK
jgi:hypothetical protein